MQCRSPVTNSGDVSGPDEASMDIVYSARSAGSMLHVMLIRSATPDDVPEVLPMVANICALHESWDAAKYGFRENIPEMYRGWLTSRAKDAKSVFLVAERGANMPTVFDPEAQTRREAGTPKLVA